MLQSTCPRAHSSTFTGHFRISFHRPSPSLSRRAISRSRCAAAITPVSSRETTRPRESTTSPHLRLPRLNSCTSRGSNSRPRSAPCRDYTSERHVRVSSDDTRADDVVRSRPFAENFARERQLAQQRGCLRQPRSFESEIGTDVKVTANRR